MVNAIVLRENRRTGDTWAPTEMLAGDAGVVVRTAYRDLPKLIRLGVVKRIRRKRNTSLLSVSLCALRSLRRIDRGAETVHDVQNEGDHNLHDVQRKSAPRAESGLHHVHPNSLSTELPKRLPPGAGPETRSATSSPWCPCHGESYQNASPCSLCQAVPCVVCKSAAAAAQEHERG